MVGQLQWLVTLGRFNLHAHVATMSRFRAAPRQGHMDRLRRIYAYAIRTKDYAVRFRTDQLTSPSYQNKILIGLTLYMVMSMKSFPDDMPEPLGKTVVTTTTLNHCLATGKSLTGWLHFVNKLLFMVFQETSQSRDRQTWFRVCCCKNSNRMDHGH